MPEALHKAIATISLSGTLVDKLEAIAAAGFGGVEIFEADLLAFDGSPGDIGRLCGDLGLTVDLYQPFRDFEAMPEPMRARNLDRAERKFDVMQALDADLMLVCSNTHPDALDDDARAAADLAEMPNAPGAAACAWDTRPWPGGATSTAGRTLGASCSGRTTRRWA